MIRLIVPIVILLVMLFGGGAWLFTGPLKDPSSRKPAAHKQEQVPSAQPETPAPAAAAKDAAPTDAPPASFDVARIDPNGTSVFAGRAEPGANVTIMGDGVPVGTAQADENGEWTFSTEHKFASADPKLALATKSAAQVRQEQAAQKKLESATKAQVAAAKEVPAELRSAGAVSSHLLKDLQGMVEDARTAARENALPPAAPNALPAAKAAPEAIAAVGASPPTQMRKSVPVPITFIFNEASFTEDGRKAAGLLLEYLKLKRFPKVSLTGHADERGTDELNMSLSRERLETVARFLKAGGFDGELELVPKGKREPFTGVVRHQYPQEDLYQLDRRVELVIMQ